MPYHKQKQFQITRHHVDDENKCYLPAYDTLPGPIKNQMFPRNLMGDHIMMLDTVKHRKTEHIFSRSRIPPGTVQFYPAKLTLLPPLRGLMYILRPEYSKDALSKINVTEDLRSQWMLKLDAAEPPLEAYRSDCQHRPDWLLVVEHFFPLGEVMLYVLRELPNQHHFNRRNSDGLLESMITHTF